LQKLGAKIKSKARDSALSAASVNPPMRDSRCLAASILMADPGWTGPIPDLSMDDTREVSTKRSFNRQTDAKAGTDQAFDAFPAYIMSHHFGDNHVMDLMSGITVASPSLRSGLSFRYTHPSRPVAGSFGRRKTFPHGLDPRQNRSTEDFDPLRLMTRSC
jgi:hypothetical protein